MHVAFVGEVVTLRDCCIQTTRSMAMTAHMGLLRLGLITVVKNRTSCVWIIRGGCKPNEKGFVKRVTFMPCHFYTSISSFRMFGDMLCYLISALITNNAGVGFNFQEFDGECRCCGLLW